MVATQVMQSSSKELNTLVSVKVNKYKQMEKFNTHTLNIILFTQPLHSGRI